MGKKSVSIETKWQILGLSKDKSKSLREIGKLVGVSEKCVRTTIKNYKLSGDIKNLPWLGQPQKLSYRDEHYIFRKVRENPRISLRNLRDDFNAALPKQCVCVETIRKVLKKQKINSYVALRKPLLTVKDRLKRRKWSNFESNFEVFNRKGRVFVKRYHSEKFDNKFVVPRLQGGGGSAGIWGCFSFRGTGVCNVYTGRINQYSYISTLENCLIPSATCFMEKAPIINFNRTALQLIQHIQ